MITDSTEKAGNVNNFIWISLEVHSINLHRQSILIDDSIQMWILHMLILQLEDSTVSMTFWRSLSPYSLGTRASSTYSVLTQSSPEMQNIFWINLLLLQCKTKYHSLVLKASFKCRSEQFHFKLYIRDSKVFPPWTPLVSRQCDKTVMMS